MIRALFYHFLGLSYPNAPHAESGLRDGLISSLAIRNNHEGPESTKTAAAEHRLGGDSHSRHGSEERLDPGLCSVGE